MNKYGDLIRLLRACRDRSNNDLVYISEDLHEKTNILDDFNIQYELQAEGVFIDLSSQALKIFKTKKSAVEHLTLRNISHDIIVVEADDFEENKGGYIVFQAQEPHTSNSKLFENIFYFYKLIEYFVEKKIASYKDELNFRLIFLSDKHGRLDVDYKTFWFRDFYNRHNDLKRQYEILKSRTISNDDYVDFFREGCIEFAKNITNQESVFYETLMNIGFINDSAKRNFELYKHKFSFSEFKNQLDEDRDKYLKEYQSNLSDFLSKISSMPIQFGVYIFLVVRFSDEYIPLLATSVLILTWSAFKLLTINRISENVGYLMTRCEENFEALIQKSGIDESEVSKERELIVGRFRKTLCLIKSYRIFVGVFSGCALLICFCLLVKL